MRYWDSSALLPLLVQEATSAQVLERAKSDPAIVTWWGTRIECVSAIARLERDDQLSSQGVRAALARLDAMSREWSEVPALEEVRSHATRLLRTHRLRAADALQLAAAIIAADGSTSSLAFMTLDGRLAEAADREGFELPLPVLS